MVAERVARNHPTMIWERSLCKVRRPVGLSVNTNEVIDRGFRVHKRRTICIRSDSVAGERTMSSSLKRVAGFTGRLIAGKPSGTGQ